MKSFKDITNQLDEVLNKSTPAGEWIHDFVHSDNPKFKGKSAAKRKQMALSAYYAKKNESAATSQNTNAEVDIRESNGKHLVHVNDGSKYDEEPHPKDVEHVMSGVKKHGGEHAGHSDKGAFFKFKSKEDADSFRSHVNKCPHKSCDAEHVTESVNEDQYTADYKIKSYVDPITGENKKRKIRPHRVDFKNSKMRGEPAQKDSPGDYGMKEDMENLDEISKHKLVQYIDKATQDVHNKALEAGKESDKPARASEFIRKYQKSGKRQAGITKAAVKLAKEEVELEEDLDTAHIHQLLANKDINSQVKNGKVHVHSSNVKAAKMHLGAAGHKHEVVGGLNESEEDDRRGAEHHQHELERQEKEKNDLDTKLKKWKNQQRAAKAMKEEVDLQESMVSASKELKSYAEKNKGSMDYKSFHTAAKHMDSGDTAALHKHIKSLDSEPRDKILTTLHKHGHDITKHGYSIREEKWHVYDTKTRAVHSTHSSKSKAEKAYNELNDKHKGYDTPGGLVQGKYGMRRADVNEEVELDEASKVYDPLTKKMVARKPIRVKMGGGATRNGVPVETGPSKYKEGLKKEEVEQIDELNKSTLASYVKKATQDYGYARRYRDKNAKNIHGDDRDLKHIQSKRFVGISKAADKLAKEEVEQIDEISKKTLGSYVKKASHSMASNMSHVTDLMHNKHSPKADVDKERNDALKKVVRRDLGIKQAVNKLTKEEVEQIDEISKATLGSYIKKSSHDVALSAKYGKDDPKETKHALKRLRGIAKATNKLTKEEVESIEELSKNTLRSYINKALPQALDAKYDAAHDRDKSNAAKLKKFADKREAGIEKADKKLDEGRQGLWANIHAKRKRIASGSGERMRKPGSKGAPSDQDLKNSQEAVEYKGMGTDVVDKKKVLNPPIPLTQKPKQVKDFKEGDEYDEKWKGYKGKSFKKESVMLKFEDFLKEAKKCSEAEVGAGKAPMQEKLVGKQHKLDKNHNGKLDADDFKKLRGEEKHCKEEVEPIEESYPTKQHFEAMAALIKSHDDEKKRSDLAHHHAGIFKGQNPRFDHKKFMHACGVHESAVCEEVEQIDEISKSTLASYIPKAARSARIHGQISTEYRKASERKKKPGLVNALTSLSDKYKKKAWSREDNIKKAADKLAKEEVEQIDELSKKTLGSYAQAATMDAAKKGNEVAKLGNNLAALSHPLSPLHKLNKRLAGHAQAIDKLTKEEVEHINEISKKTLGSYVKKASDDIADRHYRIHKDFRARPGESQADYKKDISKAFALQNKRKAGMNKAVDKLAKEEVSQEMSPYVKGTLAVMDEGKIDDLRDAQKLRKAGSSSYEKEFKPDTSHPHVQVVKGHKYGGENQKDDDTDEKSDDGEKRGRGRPSGSKSGAR